MILESKTLRRKNIQRSCSFDTTKYPQEKKKETKCFHGHIPKVTGSYSRYSKLIGGMILELLTELKQCLQAF